MVSILLAPACVPTSGLEMAAGIAADPHVGPGGRNRQLLYAGEVGTSLDLGTVIADVDEAAPSLAPPDSGAVIRSPAQAGALGVVMA